MNRLKDIKRISLIIIMFAIIFSANIISAYGCTNRNCGCRGHGISSCAGTAKCYVVDEGDHCSGHQWGSRSEESTITGSPTCKNGAYETTIIKVTVTCRLCGHTFGPYKSSSGRYRNPLGHVPSGWIHGGTYEGGHWKVCTRPVGHSGSDHIDSDRHHMTGWYQNNDGYKHRYCTDCGYSEKKPNVLTVHFRGNTSNTPYAENVPGSITTTYDHTVNPQRPTRYGYDFKGWAGGSSWTTNTLYSGSASKIARLGGGDLLNNEFVTVTLYAQWERRVNYTFNYYNDLSHRAAAAVITFIYNNDDTNKTLSVPNLKTVVDHNLSNDWALRGFSQDSGFEAVREYWPNDTINLPVKDNNGNLNPHRTFYASYKRTVKFEYVDYGDNQVYKDKKESKTAFLQFNGNEKNPTFKTQTIRNMSYSEPDSAGTKIKEKWTTRGWSHNAIPSYNVINENARKADAQVGFSQSINITTNKDHLLYALYEKQTVTNLNPNGGVFTDNNASRIVNRRYASAYCKGNNNYNAPAPSTTKPEYTLPNVYYYGEGNLIKYTQGAWNHTKGLINQNFASNMNITKDWNTHYPSGSVIKNNFTGIYNAKDTSSDADIWYRYYPLVNETLYATWTNQTEQVQALEPEVTVAKTAVWNNPAGDDSTVDYDALRNIDIDGIAKVTLTVNVKNKSGKQIKLQSFSVEDYFDTNKWDIVNASGQKRELQN